MSRVIAVRVETEDEIIDFRRNSDDGCWYYRNNGVSYGPFSSELEARNHAGVQPS
jgi:hypothetical protein